MSNSPFSGAGDTPAPAAAFPTSSTPTPGVNPTPDVPVPDMQLAPITGTGAPTVVVAKPIPPALPNTLGLQPRQRIALQALASGHGPHVAANLAGVSAVTVFRWRKYDARFIAAWNAWEAHSQQTARDCLVAANEYAARTVLRAAQGGHVAASLAVLRGLGTLAPRRPGPEVASEITPALGHRSSRSKPLPKRTRRFRESIVDADYTKNELKSLRDKAESSQVVLRDLLSRVSEFPPLARPVTPEVHAQAVRDQTAAKPSLLPMGGLCAMIVTLAPADRRPLARRIAQFQEMPEGIIDKLLESLPFMLPNAAPPPQAERLAADFEAFGATVEIRPAYRASK